MRIRGGGKKENCEWPVGFLSGEDKTVLMIALLYIKSQLKEKHVEKEQK